MSTDQGAPGTPPPGGSQPPEEPTLDVSSEELENAPRPTPPPTVTPPAEPAPPSEEVEVTLEEETAAPAAPAWPAAPVAPPPAAGTPPVEVSPAESNVPESARAASAGEAQKPIQPGQAAAAAAPVGVAAGGAPTIESGGEWYTNVGGTTYGPYRAEDIRAWLASGQVTWEPLATRAGESNWRPLHQLVEFNPSPAHGAPAASVTAGPRDRTAAGILAILLGAFGAHHWYLGNYAQAGIYLGVTVITVGFLSWIPAIAGIIEGIMYLTTTEERFQRKYKSWFMSGPD